MQVTYEARLATEKGKLHKVLDDCDEWRKKKEQAERDLHEIRSQRSALNDNFDGVKAELENEIKNQSASEGKLSPSFA